MPSISGMEWTILPTKSSENVSNSLSITYSRFAHAALRRRRGSGSTVDDQTPLHRDMKIDHLLFACTVQGYNGTVLAYGQTGSGKTHTMSGGVGHYGVKEVGITPRVINHVFAHVEGIKRRLKPGESISVSASAVEIYNEEFRDLSKAQAAVRINGWDSRSPGGQKELKLQVRILAAAVSSLRYPDTRQREDLACCTMPWKIYL
jgi:hypothetical protein